MFERFAIDVMRVCSTKQAAELLGITCDEVRRSEHAALACRKDDPLKGIRPLWLYGAENVPKWVEKFRKLIANT